MTTVRVLDQPWPLPASPLVMLACLAAALLLTAIHLSLVPRLPEPEPDPEDEDDPFVKPRYAVLLRPPFVLATFVATGLTGYLASFGGTVAPALVVWAGLSTLVAIDAVTTYLPSPLHWIGTTEMVVALVIVGLIRHDLVTVAWHAAVGAAVAGGLFWLLWRFGPMAYGDVRLMALQGALTAAASFQFLYTAVFLGTVIGAVHGIIVHLWRRRHPSTLGTLFPYGPALWAGVWAAMVAALIVS